MPVGLEDPQLYDESGKPEYTMIFHTVLGLVLHGACPASSFERKAIVLKNDRWKRFCISKYIFVSSSPRITLKNKRTWTTVFTQMVIAHSFLDILSCIRSDTLKVFADTMRKTSVKLSTGNLRYKTLESELSNLFDHYHIIPSGAEISLRRR